MSLLHNQSYVWIEYVDDITRSCNFPVYSIGFSY